LEHGLDPSNPDTGGTGVSDGYKDDDEDGWSNLQEYQNGTNPIGFNTPPAPQGFSVHINADGDEVTVRWIEPSPAVTGYVVERDWNGMTQFSVSSPELVDANVYLPSDPYWFYDTPAYRVRALYPGGSSAWSQSRYPEETINPVEAQILNGTAQTGLLLAANIPDDAAAIRLSGEYYVLGQGYVNTNFDLALETFQESLAALPEFVQTNYTVSSWLVQVVRTNGLVTMGWPELSPEFSGISFADGRTQLVQNLVFMLRAATASDSFGYIYDGAYCTPYFIGSPTTYAFSGYWADHDKWGTPEITLNGLLPFEENYRYRNFAFSATNLSSSGYLNTGAYWDIYGPGLDYPPEYLFQGTVGEPVPPALLGADETRWLVWSEFFPSTGNLDWEDVGITLSGGQIHMASGYQNLFGLPYLSAAVTVTTTNGVEILELNVGFSVDYGDGYIFPEAAQPQLETVGWYFARPNINWLPGHSAFSVTNSSPLLTTSVGQSIHVTGFAKLAIGNGYSDKFAYLGQYFDRAYRANTDGTRTTNETGFLSPYGYYFPTEPGRTILTTMPDGVSTNVGECTVQVIGLNVDANHDGVMDLSFTGSDQTSEQRSFVFWANNDYDRLALDKDDNRYYEDSVEKAGCPFTPNKMTPDCNYRDGAGNRVIPSRRDLQDFTRLWVSGVTSNLIAALPPNSTVTLSWGDVGSPNSSNPTIDLFVAADADGGIGYLTNSTTALVQTFAFAYPYVGRLGPGQSIQLNSSQFTNGWAGEHFIWCGVSNGTGALTLTIAQGGTNTLAQTTAYIQIQDIKQMYERWTIGDSPSKPPTNTAYIAKEDLQPFSTAFEYGLSDSADTSYILFVHGWNMKRWEKDRFAESAFKRLYWQGYQGRFGLFRWPTDNGFEGNLWDVLTDSHNYDNSELTACKSATGLLNKLNDLSSKYPGHVYLLAHSMGNVVAGEALRLAGSNQIVNTYIASQAAVPAHVYDSTSTNLIDFTHKHPSYPFNPANFGPTTPNIYGNWLAGNSAAAGRRINFYNANDFALSPDAWCFNQELKPDDFLGGYYTYFGSTNDPAPWNHFAFVPVGSGPINLDIVTKIGDRYEAMAYAAESRSKAFGATAGVTGLSGSLNLMTIWPTDTTGHNYADHLWHSAQFRTDTTQQWGYWRSLLRSPTVGFNISD
jgi:hypothetical protein